MTRNPFTDGEPYSVAVLNAMHNAHALEAVLEGCEVTTGTGDFETDLASGAILNGGSVDVAAQTVQHSTSDADDRVDLVTVDDTGSASVTAGTPGDPPDAPDIPDGDVLCAAVLVRGGSSEILAGDIYDYRAVRNQGEGSGLDADLLRGNSPTDLQSPIYGDGSDGEIVRSTDGDENGVISATRYEVETGVTREVTNGILVIYATEEIVIDGTLTATGYGEAGGAGGTGGSGSSSTDTPGGDGDPGSQGTAADLIGGDGTGGSGGSSTNSGDDATPTGAGGGGGGGEDAGGSPSSNGGSGGNGADGTSPSDPLSSTEETLIRAYGTPPWDDILTLVETGGSGGGGGGGGGGSGSNDTYNGGDGGDGGAGGDGGGIIVLVAPSITVSGAVRADGADGVDGNDSPDAGIPGGGGGGGSGGNGGAILLVASRYTNNGSVSASGGTGGSGGDSGSPTGGYTSINYPGGDGSDGEGGYVIEVTA